MLVSALLVESSLASQLIVHWRHGRFHLLTAEPQLDKLRRVTRYPKLRDLLKPALDGRLINDLREVAQWVDFLPPVTASPDPYDNYLLSIAVGGAADFLATRDTYDLLALGSHERTRIVTIREFVAMTRLPL